MYIGKKLVGHRDIAVSLLSSMWKKLGLWDLVGVSSATATVAEAATLGKGCWDAPRCRGGGGGLSSSGGGRGGGASAGKGGGVDGTGTISLAPWDRSAGGCEGRGGGGGRGVGGRDGSCLVSCGPAGGWVLLLCTALSAATFVDSAPFCWSASSPFFLPFSRTGEEPGFLNSPAGLLLRRPSVFLSYKGDSPLRRFGGGVEASRLLPSP